MIFLSYIKIHFYVLIISEVKKKGWSYLEFQKNMRNKELLVVSSCVTVLYLH